MSPADAAALPNLGEIIGPILQRLAPEQQALLIAVAERLAAVRYRDWAEQSAKPADRSQLLACAAREEEIAQRVEAMYPGAADIQRTILATNPDLEAVNRNIFAGRSLTEQFAIQAQGERLGAATWRAFAHRPSSAAHEAVFLACADLEEQSARVLEALLSAVK